MWHEIAAQIASHATAGRVIAGEGIVPLVAQEDFRLSEVGAFERKGLARPVRVFEALVGPDPT